MSGWPFDCFINILLSRRGEKRPGYEAKLAIIDPRQPTYCR